jgi:hypothetical protein
MLRETERKQDGLAAILPDAIVDAALAAKYGSLTPGKCAQVQADKNMPAENKTEALAELNNALKSPAPPVENRGNIDLVATYYDKLADIMGSDQQ